MAKMPDEPGRPQQGALSRGAEEHHPDVFDRPAGWTRRAPQAVLAVFSQSSPEVKNANIDLSKTYTNKFVDKAHGHDRVEIAINAGRSVGSQFATGRLRCGGDMVSAALHC